MMENIPCRRWLTTTQDEFRNPLNVKIDRNIESDEIGRYEKCMERKAREEEECRKYARETLCCAEQNANREPVHYPTDLHIDQDSMCRKPGWCRCLTTGDPNCYEETQEEKTTDDMCYAKRIYNQMEPTPDNTRQKVYSSTHFIDYRDPAFPYIYNQIGLKQQLDNRFLAYKAKVDAEDAKKEPKIVPEVEAPAERVDPNCLQLYDSLPPEKLNRPWKADERWWREETDDCRKGMVKKYIWTSTYREMNKDGAALPLAIRQLPKSSIERPPGDPVKAKAELAAPTLHHLGEVFEQWDRPQVRTVAQRCDTIYNRPCLEYDAYFKDHYLDRAKYARDTEIHERPSEENLRLARENKLRIPYDQMIPGYAGYDMIEAPPVCKVKKEFDPMDPYEEISTYQADFLYHFKEVYENPVKPIKPSDLDKYGISSNPINPLHRTPLPCAKRLTCYLECGKHS